MEDLPIFACVVEDGLSHTKEEEPCAHTTGEEHCEPRGIIVLWHTVRLNHIVQYSTHHRRRAL